MSQYNDTGYGTITLTGTVGQYKLVTGAGVVATAALPAVGVAMVDGVSGDVISYAYLNKQGTVKLIAVDAIAANAACYQAAAGKVSAAGSIFVGYAKEASGADNDVIEVQPARLPLGDGVIDAVQQALSGAGAINVTTYYTAWTTTAANAGTLADGTFPGQIKKIKLIVDGGDGTLTPTNLADGTTITFADAGDYSVLRWNGTEWRAIELGNDADGATAPVLA